MGNMICGICGVIGAIVVMIEVAMICTVDLRLVVGGEGKDRDKW